MVWEASDDHFPWDQVVCFVGKFPEVLANISIMRLVVKQAQSRLRNEYLRLSFLD